MTIATDSADRSANPRAMSAITLAKELYDRCGPQIVGTVTGPHAAPVTLRLVPQDAS